MSEVANKDLSAELYELSGWETFNVLCQSGSYRDRYGEDSDNGWFSYNPNDAVRHHQNIYPTYQAYDLGYLLRKLPEATMLTKFSHSPYFRKPWGCRLNSPRMEARKRVALYKQADTPEDAACMLAIELFKQGILTK